MTSKPLLISVVCLLACLLLAAVPVNVSKEEKAVGPNEPLTRAPHAAINIDGNSDFTGPNGVTGGAGTYGNPWIISGWAITSGSNGINIQNTDEHFIIQNCNVYTVNIGIRLDKVVNGKIEDCNVYNNINDGIEVTESDDINITDNDIYGNSRYGIKLDYSDRNEMYGNRIYDNGIGVFSRFSNYNHISYNNVSDNDIGLKLINSNFYNNITKNDVLNNSEDGISLYYESNYNNITFNNASGNNNGVYLFAFSKYNNVRNNTLNYNNYSAIYTRDSDGNTIWNNTMTNNGYYGAYLTFSLGNDIQNNTIHNNTRAGVRLFISNSTLLRNNVMALNGVTIHGLDIISWNTHIMEGNTVNGKPLRYWNGNTTGSIPANTGQAILVNCSNVDVTSRDLQYASTGVILGYCTDCTVEDNDVSNNNYRSIIVAYTTDSIIEGNTAIANNNEGIYLYNSDDNTLDDNTVSGSKDGLHIRYSDGNLIKNNSVTNCNYAINVWDSSYNRMNDNELQFNDNASIYIENGLNNSAVGNNVSNNRFTGIWLKEADDGTVTSNIGLDNEDMGIFAYDSDNNYISANKFTNVIEDGIHLLHLCSQNKVYYNTLLDCNNTGINMLSDCSGNEIKFNDILNTNNTGVRLEESNTNVISYNNISYSNDGMFFYRSPNNDVIGNMIYKNARHGIYIVTNSDGNTLSENWFERNGLSINLSSSNSINVNYNTFINTVNAYHAYDNAGSNSWNAASAGNFWSGWTSPDVDGDYIVDDPYVVGGVFSEQDDLPLAVPVGQIIITTDDINTTNEADLYTNDYDILQINKPPASVFWKLDTNAGWLSLDPFGVLSGVPQDADVGTYWVNVSVDDGTKNGDHTNFTLTVINVDYPPVLEDVNETSILEDEYFEMGFNATDVDVGYVHTWSMETNAGFLAINSTTGIINGTPDNYDVGSYWVNIKVDDGSYNDTYNFTLNVLNVNDPPEIITANVNRTMEMINYNVLYQAKDIDPGNDTMTWYMNTSADFLWLKTKTGLLSGMAEMGDAGNYWVNISVYDGNGGMDWTNFTLTVDINFDLINKPPEIDEWPMDIEFDEDTKYRDLELNKWFVDPDLDELVFKVEGNENITVDIKGDGSVELSSPKDWSGMERLTFYANDTEFEIWDHVNVTVIPVNDAPTDAAIIVQRGPYYEEGAQPAFGNASDVDLPYGDTLNFTWTSNVTGHIGIGINVNLSLPAGFHTITLNVSDSSGEWVTTSIEIGIRKREIEPDPNQTDDDIVPDDDDDDDTTGFTTMHFLIIMGVIVGIVLIIIIIAAVAKARKGPSSKDYEKYMKKGRPREEERRDDYQDDYKDDYRDDYRQPEPDYSTPQPSAQDLYGSSSGSSYAASASDNYEEPYQDFSEPIGEPYQDEEYSEELEPEDEEQKDIYGYDDELDEDFDDSDDEDFDDSDDEDFDDSDDEDFFEEDDDDEPPEEDEDDLFDEIDEDEDDGDWGFMEM